MSFLDRTKHIMVPYSLDITVEALKKALQKLSEFKVYGFDEGTITVYLKTGVSGFSFGENISVSFVKVETGGTVVSILSTPKVGFIPGGFAGLVICKKNIEKIEQALSAELKNYPQASFK